MSKHSPRAEPRKMLKEKANLFLSFLIQTQFIIVSKITYVDYELVLIIVSYPIDLTLVWLV